MNILIIGSGGREHALAWRIKQSDQSHTLWTADGNAGTAQISTNLNISPADVPTLVTSAQELSIDLVVVGPETPLAAGVVNRLNNVGIPAFGPTREAAQLESSKSFARTIITEAQVPGPAYKSFGDVKSALDFVGRNKGPMVVKADGLASGKGVVICMNQEEAKEAVISSMSNRIFGPSGDVIVIEEFLTGQEVSVFAFTDGEYISNPIAACDYKRACDGNIGPNTGGMGSYTHPSFWSNDLENQIMSDIMLPTVTRLSSKGIPYKGILYAGIMLTETGPQVLEFNCRLGDPETQVIMPLLKTDPIEIMTACIDGTLDAVNVNWGSEPHVGVVMTSIGYPGEYKTGMTIAGLGSDTTGTQVFHAGTTVQDTSGDVITSGGRVLTVVGWGESLANAKANAYARVNTITFNGANWRTDIGE
ncbi:MAG: phosphoribosylamine--glycine ligase [Chloroflexota bacterium]|nr:phosphoribosylamine--glycine ligase [Chloroflexota bacterium]